MVLLGAASAFLELESRVLHLAIRRVFAHYGEEVIAMNLQAFEAGYRFGQKIPGHS
jgi:indolepyruvate ferredoxin oxidoreductase beta subunit